MISVVTLGQPDLRQIFVAFVLGDICWRDMTVIVKNGQGSGKLEIELLTRGCRKQEVIGEEAFLHRGWNRD